MVGNVDAAMSKILKMGVARHGSIGARSSTITWRGGVMGATHHVYLDIGS